MQISDPYFQVLKPHFKCATHSYVVGDISCKNPSHLECHYKIKWSINPHMIDQRTDILAAEEEHEGLVRFLLKEGAHLFRLPFICSAYDSVFVKDNAFLFTHGKQNYALFSNLKDERRNQEQCLRELQLRAAGFRILHSDTDSVLEGGDLVISAQSREIFLGFGFRSAEMGSDQIRELLGISAQSLQLINPYFYHLDTALFISEEGIAVAFKNAFSSWSWQKLLKSHAIDRLIEVDPEEAMAFGCNLVQMGQTLIVGSFLPKLIKKLGVIGYQLVHLPLTQFQKAGGSAACLVSKVHQLSDWSLRLTPFLD